VDPEGPGNSRTQGAVNLIGGIGFRAGSAVPYLQSKIIAKDGAEFSVAFGVRF
jgi:hypothetical protein